ncbi:APC family permease [Nocardioides cavernae]|uniref:APC family permease n=1 Tax=Nocardioides cavernae TaxID=1921566 RepID=A0ABR8N9H9_9ACTN|nr:APC family permease [Nocardioides cavernae]MBD3924247.1 APC family permease [Nocardioides cavernae]MBM7510814.1 amino acid transporter [Nocardioides cavernae]
MLTVLALAAPLGAIAGFVPVIIYAGNGVGTPMTFLTVGVILTVFAVGFTTMTRHHKIGGAFYAYITAGLGRPLGLGASFVALVGYMTLMLGAYGLLGVSIDALLVTLFGVPSVTWWVYSLLGWVAVTALAHFNVELSGRVLSTLMVLEVLIVMALNIPALVGGGDEGHSVASFTPTEFLSGAPGLGILFASACFLGFEATAIYRAEVKDPDRTVPRATYLAVTLITAFYVISSWALITAVGPDKVVAEAEANATFMFADALGSYYGNVAKDIAQILLVTSVFASVLSSHNPIARYIFSLGKDGVFPSTLGQAHHSHGSPAKASFAASVAGLLITLPFVVAGTDVVRFYSWMFGFGAFALLLLMACTSVAVIAFFRKHHTGERMWNTTIAPVLALIGLGGVLVIVSLNFDALTGAGAALSFVFQGIVYAAGVLGIVLALLWRKSRPSVYQRIGGQAEQELEAV